MKPMLQVGFNLVDKAIWFPRFSPEWNGDGLSEVVELQSTASNGIHDRGIVYDSVLDTKLHSSKDQVSVGSRPACVRNGYLCLSLGSLSSLCSLKAMLF